MSSSIDPGLPRVACVERVGSQISHIKGEAGGDRNVIIQDPAGAFLALIRPGEVAS